jgi:transcription initiation factor TFIID subunit 13
MSYSPHTHPAAAGAAQGQDQAQAATTYSYGQYTTTGAYGQHAQTLTPYPTTYQTPYATGITGYGSWPYAYGYVAQQPHTYTSKPATSSSVAVPSTSQVGPQRTTFTTYSSPYTPYRKDAGQTSSTSGTGTTARGPRKQANFKGLFAKERELDFAFAAT